MGVCQTHTVVVYICVFLYLCLDLVATKLRKCLISYMGFGNICCWPLHQRLSTHDIVNAYHKRLLITSIRYLLKHSRSWLVIRVQINLIFDTNIHIYSRMNAQCDLFNVRSMCVTDCVRSSINRQSKKCAMIALNSQPSGAIRCAFCLCCVTHGLDNMCKMCN